MKDEITKIQKNQSKMKNQLDEMSRVQKNHSKKLDEILEQLNKLHKLMLGKLKQ